jgi:hypothetical protein
VGCERHRLRACPSTKDQGSFGSSRRWSDAHILVTEVPEPVSERACSEDRRSSSQAFLILVVLPVGEVGPADQLAERLKNFGSSAPTVRKRSSAVA